MTDDPRIDPADLRNVRFPGSSRRYDARSVDQFLETVAKRIAATNALVDQLQARIAELDAAAPAPAPPRPQLALLDDDELVKLVGEETASVLSTARRAADEIRSKAEESAARMIREATAEVDRLSDQAKVAADELTGRAEQVLERATTEATTEAERIRADAVADAERTTAEAAELLEAERTALESRRAEAEAEAERILEDAREEGRGMVNEAKEVRTRILEDLQRRRDAARDQIERLLAGRERLLAAYGLVRENLDEITGQLADALPEPGEPELPDGFVGIVGSGGPAADHDGAEGGLAELGGVEQSDEDVPEPDDTVAPAAPPTETEADVAEAHAPVGEAAADTEEADAGEAGPEVGGPEVGEEVAVPGPEVAADADEPVPGDEHGASAPVTGEGADVAQAEVQAEEAEGSEVEGAEVPAEEPDAEDVRASEDLVEEAAAAEAEPEPEPEPEPTELAADEAEAHTAGGGGDVDELFARLRAERERSVAKARQVVDADEPADADAEPEPGPEPEPAGAPAAEAAVEDVAVEDEPTDDVSPEGQALVPDVAVDVDRVPAEFIADDASLTARAAALEPLEGGLNRALKRRLADEQNGLLDLLRRSGTTAAEDLLPDLATQIDGYATLAEEHLAAAAVAGGHAVGRDVDVDVASLATALGAALVEPFRRRVERSAAEVDGDADELDERLRALYREWKVQHIGPVADDALLSAYALGTLSAAEPDGRVRWRIDPTQGPCPDAQDNALAGEVVAGDAFPTGDTCPQAHPGCRCLLVTG